MAINLPEPDKDWQVVEHSFDVAANRHYESILALGTGYLTTRSSLEERFVDDDQSNEYDWFPGNTTLMSVPATKSKWGTYMHVLAARHPFRRMGLVNLPHYLGLELTIGGETLDMENSQVSDYRRFLDLRTATLYRTLTWRTEYDDVITVRFKRFMDPAQRFVCVQQCELEMVSGNAEVGITSFVDNNVRTNGYDKFDKHEIGHDGKGMIFSDITTNIDNRVVTASVIATDPSTSFDIDASTRMVSASGFAQLMQGERLTITKISTVVSDAYYERDRLLETATEILSSNISQPVDALHEKHVEEWARRWDLYDVEIEADDDDGYNSQLAIRQAIYHLLRAKAEDEDRNLVCPKGMVGELYYGAAFWDMEIFINPFFLYTNPAAGRNTPSYRFRNLPQARELAKSYGYGGARYPWMSAPDGHGVTTLWHYADHQIHITADVIIGLWHYYKISNDVDFLFDCGAEMIIETARYWRERVDTIEGRPGYHIYGVMGPDEYKPLTNNNAYTNYTAAFNLRLAGTVVDMMREQAPDRLEKLRAGVDLSDDELAAFTEIADGLVISVDEERNIVWQCDGFDTAFAEIDIDEVWKDRTVLFGKYMSQEKLFRYRTMKQSDVVALMSVFPRAFSDEQKVASFDYYKKYNIHDSSNSMCHHMIVAANIGRPEEAYESWLRSLDIDFGTQPRSADGVHCANVGGMWQEVVFGFAGLLNALSSDTMSFRPCMPKQIRKIAFKITWKGSRIAVTITHSELQLENLSDREITFEVCGKEYAAGPGEMVNCAC